MGEDLGLLEFSATYFERAWGGANVSGFQARSGVLVGEAWLLSDHPNCQSLVAAGPLEGKSLHELIEGSPGEILGSRVQPVGKRRFPLLLKLIHAGDVLSVQVHPDDADANGAQELKQGKTEMWHVLRAKPGGKLFCGLAPGVTKEALKEAVADETADPENVQELLTGFEAVAGTSVFVPAGTVHAVGEGHVLAEIQQNSDTTYRLYDWGRRKPDGTPRKLHRDEAFEVIDFDSDHRGAAKPLSYAVPGGVRSVLAACRYFAAELLRVEGTMRRDLRGESCHILLVTSGGLVASCQREDMSLPSGHAVLVPGAVQDFTLTGDGECLDYYVPDLTRDIVEPLRLARHAAADIVLVGGRATGNDLRGLV